MLMSSLCRSKAYRTTLATNGRETSSENLVSVPFAEPSGEMKVAIFGESATLSADAQADGLHVTIEYWCKRQNGTAPATGLPPSSTLKLRATVTVPSHGGEVTLREGDTSTGTLAILQRENLPDGKFAMKILVTSAPPKH